MQISINNPTEARRWLSEVQAIHEDYSAAMTAAGNSLQSINELCEGTIVDEIAKYGTAILDAAQETFKAIDKIADTVNTILDKLENFGKDVVQGIGKAFTNAFNKNF